VPPALVPPPLIPPPAVSKVVPPLDIVVSPPFVTEPPPAPTTIVNVSPGVTANKLAYLNPPAPPPFTPEPPPPPPTAIAVIKNTSLGTIQLCEPGVVKVS
jgi:hypothetical protein